MAFGYALTCGVGMRSCPCPSCVVVRVVPVVCRVPVSVVPVHRRVCGRARVRRRKLIVSVPVSSPWDETVPVSSAVIVSVRDSVGVRRRKLIVSEDVRQRST